MANQGTDTWMSLWRRLTPLYDEGEAKAIARMVLESRFGLNMTDIYTDGISSLASDARDELERIMLRLEKAEPVQYVLGYAEFHGRRFAVSKGVLIPRPETEELCQWIIRDTEGDEGPDILDIGTGSGCIAVTLANEVAEAAVTAWDVSSAAIICCEENARQLGVMVDVVRQDALTPPDDTARWDIIVSNPPYICESERQSMHVNVTGHEPAEALFVPDDDPLLFYRAVCRYALHALRPGGALYFEINPHCAGALLDLIRVTGFDDVTLLDDSFGKQRFIKARLSIRNAQHETRYKE